MADDDFDAGMRIRSEVLGAAHVARTTAAATDFDRDFQDFITRYAWGSVRRRDDLTRHTRSLLTIGLLAALGQVEELRLHIRATRNTGVSADQIREVLLQVAVYAGVPAANTAFREAQAVLEDMPPEET